jgi:hypothetical protein
VGHADLAGCGVDVPDVLVDEFRLVAGGSDPRSLSMNVGLVVAGMGIMIARRTRSPPQDIFVAGPERPAT